LISPANLHSAVPRIRRRGRVARMKRLSFCIIAFGLLTGATSALAADLPVKSWQTPGPSWSGCYIGGNVGGSWTDFNMAPVSIAGLVFPQGTAAGSSVAGGGQFGCDYEVAGNWVVGLRGMWDATRAQGTTAGTIVVPPPGASLITNAQITSFATAVARAGYSLGPALLYGVGGVALAQNQYQQSIATIAASLPLTGNDAPAGWVAGGGFSWMLGPNWDVWVEYDYLGFGGRTVSTVGTTPPVVSLPNSISQRVQTISVGVDLRFTNLVAGLTAR
jgi:outer membrane immunogenic protein